MSGFRALLLAVLVILGGCATLPPGDVPEDSLRKPFAHPLLEETRHYTDDDFAALTPSLVFILPDARFLANNPDLLDALGISRPGASRIERVVVLSFAPEDSDFLWVYGSFPPLPTAIGLRRAGWRRQKRGVWTNEQGHQFTHFQDGVLRGEMPLFLPFPTAATSGPLALREVDANLMDESGEELVLYIAHPPLPGGLAAIAATGLAPTAVLLHIVAGEMRVRAMMPTERDARVALVSLRFLAMGILDFLEIPRQDSFSIQRQENWIEIRGLAYSAEELFRRVGGIQ